VPGVIFNLNSVLVLEKGVRILSGSLSGHAPKLGADGFIRVQSREARVRRFKE
jgi:hypothetical protein